MLRPWAEKIKDLQDKNKIPKSSFEFMRDELERIDHYSGKRWEGHIPGIHEGQQIFTPPPEWAGPHIDLVSNIEKKLKEGMDDAQ
jgi:hypothetical protein